MVGEERKKEAGIGWMMIGEVSVVEEDIGRELSLELAVDEVAIDVAVLVEALGLLVALLVEVLELLVLFAEALVVVVLALSLALLVLLAG